jgi:hypothetical protein
MSGPLALDADGGAAQRGDQEPNDVGGGDGVDHLMNSSAAYRRKRNATT